MVKKYSILIFICLFLACNSSSAMGSVTGATEWTQLMNNYELAQHTINQIRQLYNEAQMIKYQIEQLKSIRVYTTGQWDDVFSVLQQLDGIVRQGQGLSYSMSDLERRFKELYPGYKPPVNFQNEYKDWSENTMDSIKSSLMAANLQARYFVTEKGAMDKIRSLSDSAVGQTQAIQAGNMMANEMVSQLQKLRQLIMSQMQAQNSYMANEVNKDAAIEASVGEFFQRYSASGNNVEIKLYKGDTVN